MLTPFYMLLCALVGPIRRSACVFHLELAKVPCKVKKIPDIPKKFG